MVYGWIGDFIDDDDDDLIPDLLLLPLLPILTRRMNRRQPHLVVPSTDRLLSLCRPISLPVLTSILVYVAYVATSHDPIVGATFTVFLHAWVFHSAAGHERHRGQPLVVANSDGSCSRR